MLFNRFAHFTLLLIYFTSCTGHWIGDPCEYGVISLHTLPTSRYKEMQEAGENYQRMAEISFGVAAGFGSCMAQAYNQGRQC